MTLMLIVIWNILSSFFLVKLFLRITLLDKLLKRKLYLVAIVNSGIALACNLLDISYLQYLFFIMSLFCFFYRDRLMDCRKFQMLFSAIFSVLIIIYYNYLQQVVLESLMNVMLKNVNIEVLIYVGVELVDILILCLLPQQPFIYVFDMLKQSEFFKVSLSILSLIFFYLLGIIENVKGNKLTDFIYDNEMVSILVVFVGMLSAFITMFVGFHIRQAKQRKEMYKELEKYSKEIAKINDEMSLFRHDYMSILYSLRMAINNRDIDSIEMIYNDTIAPTVKIFDVQSYEITKLDRICISELKSILFVKINMAKNQDIDVSLKVNGVLEKTSVSKIILLRIFSIFLDNAIAGAKGSENKQIKITFDEENDGWLFKISNTIYGKVAVDKIFDRGYTTKTDEFSKNSGLGLHYVKTVIKKYSQLELETETDKDYFTQILYMEKAS